MANPKYHWAILVSDPSKHRRSWKGYAGLHYVQACGRAYRGSTYAESAAVYVSYVTKDPDWYCSDCARAARLALAKESVPKPIPRPARSCSNCRSGAINPGHHGRAEDTDLDLCDVCYWRKRASAPKADTRTDSDRYAELRQLVEDCQREAMDSASPVVVFDNALRLVLDWRHR